MSNLETKTTVAIIGGGFSGAAVAAHLARHPGFVQAKIVVFEPRDHLGRGLAYDTADAAHRINVPASRMSLAVDDDDHFTDWLTAQGEAEKDPEALAGDGKLYPRRGVFGRYVSAFAAPFLRSGVIRHEKSRVVAVRRERDGWRVTGENGSHLHADILVIATSHPAPQAPAELDRILPGHPRYIPDPTVPDVLDAIRPDDRVLVVGAGLTSADVVASLERRGHRGPVTVFSRRGLRSRGHATVAQEPFGDFTTRPAATAVALTRKARATIAAAEAQGLTWHAVLDALRTQGGTIWRALPLAEKRRLVRHLRPFWDVHRFRIAPQVEAVLERGLKSGRIRLLAASLARIERNGETITVDLRRRATGRIDRTDYDAVVVTTGPGHGGILSSQAWLAQLAAAGILKADTIGLGLACDDDSRAIDATGRAIDTLFISGPLARGTFGELMGLPQVNEHAVLVANGVAAMVASAARDRKQAGSVYA